MQSLKFDIQGMTCGGCSGSVKRALSAIDGVSHVDVSLRPGSATLEADTSRITTSQIEAAITSLGFPTTLQPMQSRP